MVIKDGAKMSKSKGNVVDPDELVDKYGTDTVRIFSMFAAPPERDLDWSDQGVEGAYRFLNRIWFFVYKHRDILSEKESSELKELSQLSTMAAKLLRKTHQTIKRVTNSIERDYHFNTAIAALMELINEVMSFRSSGRDDTNVLKFSMLQVILLLSPFAPHIAEELWRMNGKNNSIFHEPWPEWDDACAKEEEIELVIQVNGKVRGKVMIPAGLDDKAIKEKAFSNPKIKEYMKDNMPKKVIVVRGRLVNIVV
jgi:leucyl-tRNA synthetase